MDRRLRWGLLLVRERQAWNWRYANCSVELIEQLCVRDRVTDGKGSASRQEDWAACAGCVRCGSARG